MSTTSIIDIGYYPLCKIYGYFDDDQDRINLFFSCKKLMDKKYLVLDNSVYQIELFKYQSIIDCCVNVFVRNVNLSKLYNLLYKNTLASINTTLQYHQPESLIRDQKRLRHNNSLPRIQSLTINRLPEASQYLPSQQVIDFANYIPPSVTTITFDIDFAEPIANNLPNTIKRLEFKRCYNKLITSTSLPSSIESLHLGNYYDKPITPGSLPPNLTELYIGGGYDKFIPKDALPSTIHTLSLLPTLNARYFPPYSISYPPSVKHLTLGMINRHLEGDELPPNLEILEFTKNSPPTWTPSTLPTSIRKLVLMGTLELTPNYLPNHITHLVFGSSFDSGNIKFLSDLPGSITHLKLGTHFNLRLPKTFPPNLKELVFGTFFNQKLKNLPDSLEHLALGDQYTKELPSPLPLNLKVLQVGKSFRLNGIIPKNFPQDFELLVINTDKSSIVPPIPLPTTIERRTGYYEPDFINDYEMTVPSF